MLTRIVIIIFVQALIAYFMVSTTFAGIIDAQGLFKTHCVICHGEDGKGKTDLGEGLGARDFTDKKFQDSITDEKILEQIDSFFFYIEFMYGAAYVIAILLLLSGLGLGVGYKVVTGGCGIGRDIGWYI